MEEEKTRLKEFKSYLKYDNHLSPSEVKECIDKLFDIDLVITEFIDKTYEDTINYVDTCFLMSIHNYMEYKIKQDEAYNYVFGKYLKPLEYYADFVYDYILQQGINFSDYKEKIDKIETAIEEFLKENPTLKDTYGFVYRGKESRLYDKSLQNVEDEETGTKTAEEEYILNEDKYEPCEEIKEFNKKLSIILREGYDTSATYQQGLLVLHIKDEIGKQFDLLDLYLEGKWQNKRRRLLCLE